MKKKKRKLPRQLVVLAMVLSRKAVQQMTNRNVKRQDRKSWRKDDNDW